MINALSMRMPSRLADSGIKSKYLLECAKFHRCGVYARQKVERIPICVLFSMKQLSKRS